jgi:probable HAF family extracellular repeat protein
MNTKISALLALSLLAGPMTTQADSYAYTIIDYPGADNTQTFGLNERGMVAGTASSDAGGIPSVAFVYDSKTTVFTPLPTLPGYGTALVGINENGVGVGSANEIATGVASGMIFDKGAFTIFSHPGSTSTFARAISNKGLVTGYADRADGKVVGFLYDPATGQFVDFMPSNFTIAQGINDRGDIVGSANLNRDEAYPGSPPGTYGFLRDKGGVITLFRVNGTSTRARGISSTGVISGFVPEGGFVAKLPTGGGFQALTIPDANLVVVPVPGATGISAQGIDNTGRIVGSYNDEGFHVHGFLAAPTK